MSQPTTEIDKTKQTPPETNGLGVPSMGENQHMSNGTAVEEVIEADQTKIDGTSAAEEILEATPIHPTSPSVEPEIKLHPDVSNAHVEVVSSQAEIQPLQDAAKTVGGSVTGEVAHTLGEAEVQYNTPKDTSGVGVMPNPFETGEYAKGNGKALNDLWKERMKKLLHLVLGGQKVEPEKPQQTIEPKTT